MPKAAAVVSGWPVDTPPEGPMTAGRRADPAGWRSCLGTCGVPVAAKATTKPAAPTTSARQLPLMVHLATSHRFERRSTLVQGTAQSGRVRRLPKNIARFRLADHRVGVGLAQETIVDKLASRRG